MVRDSPGHYRKLEREGQLSDRKLEPAMMRIRKCAELLGSGDALAKAAGIPRSTLETYLSGKAEPKIGRLAAIAQAVGVNGHWLLTGDGPMMRSETEKVRIAALDQQMLEDVIRYAEEGLIETNRVLPPDKKALLFRLLYEEVHEREGKMDLQKLDSYLKLASIGKATTES